MDDGSRDDSGTARAEWQDLLRGGVLFRFSILCLGIWLHAADTLLVATVMPAVVAEIGGGTQVYWAIALYEVGSIVAGAAMGLFCARFGLRFAMSAAAVVYAGGCAASAMAPDIFTMLSGRLFQGLGGGAMVAIAYVAVGQLFPDRYWPKLLAIMSGIWGASALCGPLIGGVFASYGLWRGAFWAFAAQAALLLIAAVLFIGVRHKETQSAPSAIPIRRLAVLACGILSICVAGDRSETLSAAAFVVLGLALLALFVRLDGRHRAPLFPGRPFDLRRPVGAGIVAVLTLSMATVSFTTYGPLLMDLLYGATPLTAGYMIAIESVAWTVAAIAVANASARWDGTIVKSGSVLISLGVVGFALLMPDSSLLMLIPWAVLMGAGFGMAWAFIVQRVVSAASKKEKEVAASCLPTTQMIGYALGAACSGIAANAGGFAQDLSVVSAQTVGFWVFAAFVPVALIGNLAAWYLMRRPIVSQ